MIHPDTELKFISDEIGYGVVATKLIPAGTITWTLDALDRELTPQQVEGMDELYRNILDFYSYRNNKGNFVLCWDNGRYFNHSFKASCFSTAYDFEIAMRDIQPGEQLTDDYGYLNVTEPFKGVDEGTERKVVYPNDLEMFHEEWDKNLQRVFPKIVLVPQPLRKLIDHRRWNEVKEVIRGDREIRSIKENYYEIAHSQNIS